MVNCCGVGDRVVGVAVVVASWKIGCKEGAMRIDG